MAGGRRVFVAGCAATRRGAGGRAPPIPLYWTPSRARFGKLYACPVRPVPPNPSLHYCSLSLELSDTQVYEPEIRALLGTPSNFCDVVPLPPPSTSIGRQARHSARPPTPLDIVHWIPINTQSPCCFSVAFSHATRGGSRDIALGSDSLNRLHPSLLRRNVKLFRGGLTFKAHRLVHHSTLGWRLIKKKIPVAPELQSARQLSAAPCPRSYKDGLHMNQFGPVNGFLTLVIFWGGLIKLRPITMNESGSKFIYDECVP